jgi:hypothetical protein
VNLENLKLLENLVHPQFLEPLEVIYYLPILKLQ